VQQELLSGLNFGRYNLSPTAVSSRAFTSGQDSAPFRLALPQVWGIHKDSAKESVGWQQREGGEAGYSRLVYASRGTTPDEGVFRIAESQCIDGEVSVRGSFATSPHLSTIGSKVLYKVFSPIALWNCCFKQCCSAVLQKSQLNSCPPFDIVIRWINAALI